MPVGHGFLGRCARSWRSPVAPFVEVPSKKKNEGPAPEWRNEVQRALYSFSIQNLLATMPVVHTPALASVAGAT